VGKPVIEYVKLRRLAKVAEALVANENTRIVDISIEFGFENHETFTRSFKEVYGLTPNTYRKQKRPLSHFVKPDLSMKYRLIDKNVPLIAEGIVLEVSERSLNVTRQFLGLSIDIKFSDNPGIDFLAELWYKFHSRKNEISNMKETGNEIGVGSPSDKEGYLRYYVGTEVNAIESMNEFDSFTMPTGSYIVCAIEAENQMLLTTEALDKAVKYMYGTWLNKNEILTEPIMVEVYIENMPEFAAMEIWFKRATNS